MPIRFQCEACDKTLTVKDELGGKKIRCPGCREVLTVPLQEAEPVTAVRARRDGPPAPSPRDRREEEDEPRQSKRRRAESDEEDEAPRRRRRREDSVDDDEEPRRKKKKKKASQGVGLLPFFVGGGLLIVLIVVGLVLWLTLGRSAGPNAPGPIAAGPGKPNVPAKGGSDALDFNQRMVQGNKRLAAAGITFANALQATMAQGGGNTKNLRTELQRMSAEVNAVRNESKSWSIPNKPSAQKLHNAYQKFLNSQDTIVQKMGQVVSILENAKTPFNQRQQQMQQIGLEVTALEQRELAELQQAQRDYARENNIMLLP